MVCTEARDTGLVLREPATLHTTRCAVERPPALTLVLALALSACGDRVLTPDEARQNLVDQCADVVAILKCPGCYDTGPGSSTYGNAQTFFIENCKPDDEDSELEDAGEEDPGAPGAPGAPG
jgi:hypothetical protein